MNLNDPQRAKEELDRAVESGSQERIARVAMFNIWPLVTAHIDALIAAVSILETPVLDRYPVLRLVHPMTAVLARATRPFTPHLYTDEARTKSPEEIDLLLLTQLIAFRASGDIASALLYAKRLAERIHHVRVEARDHLDGPLWYFHLQIGSTYLCAGDSAHALLEFATARQLGRLSPQQDAERVALSRVAIGHAIRGALGDAETALADSRALPEPTSSHRTMTYTTERTTAALIAVDRLADDMDERLAELSPYDSTDLVWPLGLLARTRAMLARWMPDDAIEAIRLSRDSHSLQPECLAFDVVGSASIEARIVTGELNLARRIATEHANAGPLTRIASVRLMLHERNLDAAGQEIRALIQDQSLGPAQRAELILLSGWWEFARTETLHEDTASQLHRVLRRRDNRRLAVGLPTQVIASMRTHLSTVARDEFDRAAEGLVHVDLEVRPLLTPGELRVLAALADERTNIQMAGDFHVSPNTVKTQLRSLYRKLDCSTREQALRVAHRMHLLPLDPEA